MPSTGDAFIAKIQMNFYLIYTSAPSCFCSDFIKSHLFIHHIYPQAPVYQYRPFLHPSSIQIRHCRPGQFRPGQWEHRHRQLRYHFPRPWEHSDHLVQVNKEIMMMMKENQNAHLFFRR